MKSFTLVHGYLGRAPETKTFKDKDGNDRDLVNFSVGCSRDFGDKTDWYDVTMFGSRAKVIEKFFVKGSQIIVWGRMQADTTEKDGQKRKFWKLIAEGFDFCDSKDSARGQNDGAIKDDDLPDSWEQLYEYDPFRSEQ